MDSAAGPGVPVEKQIEELMTDIDTAERDAARDLGAEAVEAGGWTELIRSVIGCAGPHIGDEAKREVLRMTGLAEHPSQL